MCSGQQTTSLMDNESRRKRISLSQKLEMVKNGQITESEQTGGDRGQGEERWGVSAKGYGGGGGPLGLIRMLWN